MIKEIITLCGQKGVEMERLTERNPSWIDDELWERACEPDCEEIDAVYRKLKDYEDLEERLNKVYGDCDGLLLRVIETLEKHPGIDIANNTLKSRLLTDEDVDKWEEYKQLEEQGRLLKLPCKVGNTVYVISMGKIISLVVEEISTFYVKNEKIINVKCQNADIFRNYIEREFGRVVFLTKEEAEVKLKELWKEYGN